MGPTSTIPTSRQNRRLGKQWPIARRGNTGERSNEKTLPPASQSPSMRRRSWHPATLQPAVLATVVLFTIAVIVVIQVLRHYTAVDNGFAFSTAANSGFAPFTTFGYLYLPTIIAVFFSVLWNWIDLDVKRIEPFFQMATSSGASLQSSLLLQYPFDYVALVPLQAFRRRHWSVLYSGTITVLIFWGITPLQNSMITTTSVARTIATQGVLVNSVSAINSQLPNMDTNVLQNAWASMWYNQSLPAFSTNTSTFSPFGVDQALRGAMPDASVSGSSTKYWTTFDCRDAQFVWHGGNETYGSYLGAKDQDGCEISLSIFDARQVYCGRAGPAEGTGGHAACSFLRNGDHCDNVSNTLLIGLAKSGWALENGTTGGLTTAQFCDMQYWSQQGSLTVRMEDMRFQSFLPSGEPSLLSQAAFNTTEFEAMLATGSNKNSRRYGYHQTPFDATGNASSINSLEQSAQFDMGDIDTSQKPTFGFLYALQHNQTQHNVSFGNATDMASGFEQTHQFLFAMAMSDVMGKVDPDANVTLSIQLQDTAVALVDPLGWIVQGFLGLIALLTLVLLISSWKRTTNLDSNPDSLTRISQLLEPDSTTAIAVNKLHYSSSADIFEHASFRTNSQQNQARITVQPETVDILPTASPRCAMSAPALGKGLPFHLSPTCALLFITVLCGTISLLAMLQQYSVRNDGIPLPSDNQIVQQLVLNYVPIAFATFIEPLWTLLNRSLCLLQPFIELNKLESPASRSLATRYSSLPPQLVFMRALKNRHLVLVGVCLISISSNILAITLGALFAITPVQRIRSTSSSPTTQAIFNGTNDVGILPFNPNITQRPQNTLQDHFYLAQSNLSRGTRLPPWTASEYFFVPQAFDSSFADTYTVPARGFGVRTDCEGLATDISQGLVAPIMDVDKGYFAEESWSIGMAGMFKTGTTRTNCTTPMYSWNDRAYSLINGTAAYENVDVLEPPAGNTSLTSNATSTTNWSPCSEMFIVSFSRTNNATAMSAVMAMVVDGPEISPAPTSPVGPAEPCHDAGCRNERKRQDGFSAQASPLNVTSQTHLACRSSITSAMFSVNVDKLGRVLSYTNTSAVSDNTTAYFRNEADRRNLISAMNNAFVIAGGSVVIQGGYTTGRVVLHNTTVARQWFTYLMMIAANDASIVDATLPAPAAEDVIPMVSTLSSLLGSILLSLYQDHLFPFRNMSSSSSDSEQATFQVTENRVFLDPTMYTMTMTLLSVHVAAAFVFYSLIPRNLLKRLPTTLADQLGFFEGSTLIEDRDWQPRWKYGYGKFIAADGKPRTGIERVPLVQPLNINQARPWWQFWRN